MRILILFLGIMFALIAEPAFAITMDYTTYNGREEIVGAFKRIALIFSDNLYKTYFVIFAVISFSSPFGMSAIQALAGGGFNPIKPLLSPLFGLLIVAGLIYPKGNLHIYDAKTNSYENVPEIPQLIVLIAGTLNNIEVGLSKVIYTAKGLTDFGGINYSLIHAMSKGDLNDYYLEQSLSNYYLDCGIPSLGQGTSGNRQALLHESSDMMAVFETWKNPALFTTYHADDSDVGAAMSCSGAWDAMKARLISSNTFDNYLESVCEKSGFNVSDSSDAHYSTQILQCKSSLNNAASLFGVSASAYLPLLRSMALAKSVSRVVDSSDFSRSQRMLVNRQMVAEGFGMSQALEQWVPKIRAFMIAVVLGAIPIVVLFIVTSFFKEAMMLLFGLFSWIAMWGVCDTVALVMAEDLAADAFNTIRRQHFSIEALLNSPEAAIQALGVFGQARAVAMTMATVLSVQLFKFSGYSFSQMGEQWQRRLETIGESSGRQTMLPEEKANLQRSLTGAVAFQGAMSQIGFNHMASGQAMGDMYQGKLSSHISNDLSMNTGSYNLQRAHADGFRTQADYSYTQEMGGLGVAGEDSGQARAYFEAGQAKATLHAGPKAIEASERLLRGEATGRASVAGALGADPYSFGHRSGMRQSSIAAADLWRDKTVAQTLGLNSNDIRDNVQYQQISNSQVQLSPNADMIERMADNPNVDLAQDQRDFMRNNPNAGYAQSFSVNPDGQLVAGSIKTGVDISSGHFSRFRDGSSHEIRDDSIISNRRDYDVTEAAHGGNRLLDHGHVKTLMTRAFNLNGTTNQSSLASFGKGYGDAMSDRGYTLSSSQSDELSGHARLSAFSDGSVTTRGGVSFLGVGVAARFHAGVRGSSDISNGWSSSDSLTTNKNLLLMQSLGSGAMEQAKSEYAERHGALPTEGSREAEKIYDRASHLFHDDFESLVSNVKKDVKKEFGGVTDGGVTDTGDAKDIKKNIPKFSSLNGI